MCAAIDYIGEDILSGMITFSLKPLLAMYYRKYYL